MSHPLTSGQAIATQFDVKSILSPYPGCPGNMEDLRLWIESTKLSVTANNLLFGYTAGTMLQATPEDRDRPRFMFDDDGRYLGLALWMPDLQGWTVAGQIGQLMTVIRTKATVAEDIASKPLAGWKLANGTSSGVPDLTAESDEKQFDTYNNSGSDDGYVKIKFPSQWFRGTSPDWDVYTLAYTGT
ncbi:hypothetical protein SAMN02745166_01087 [Prosthecobacter debontii]|uniref:Uncharacterized protein n=1 Tax=Prosthecobacter debontii TaxID=48467 RepID=A0A1T4X847_9BACT|nr:hypothetical protein [Prosthecobacter debontii]SKA85021.1 hypothetical protein SAMN02745166_01087 [Prosthecobacter debontii]